MYRSASPTMRRARWFLAAGLCFALASGARGMIIVREPMSDNVYACARGATMLYLECSPPKGNEAGRFFATYLAKADDWKQYKDRLTVAVPFGRLNGTTQRAVLETLFPGDRADRRGWRHTVVFEGEQGTETWWALAEWFTGLGTNQEKLRAAEENKALGGALSPGDVVLIPFALLPDYLRSDEAPIIEAIEPPAETEGMAETPPTAPTAPAEEAAEAPKETAPPPEASELEYGGDTQGDYALYRLKKGEALYSAVIARFTDFSENKDIRDACAVIQKRSGIADVRKMEPGTKVLIPMDMLADRFHPKGSEQRAAFDEIQQETKKMESAKGKTKSKDLEGIVIILDAGHGGRDQGAAVDSAGLLEDEINYDIVCRIKRALEATRAKVLLTALDPSEKYTPSNNKKFTHDQDEVLLTTPQYENYDARISAYLRAFLVNSMYAKERKAGVPENKILFASIHCDCLFNEKMRGAMVYVPGAKYRRASFTPTGTVYGKIAEAKSGTFTVNAATAKREEALSRTFAACLLQSFSTHKPKITVHDTGDPIRNVIRQSGGRAYVPAVLNYTDVPAKVLVETANMTNPKDQDQLADPEWREAVADAFVNALKTYFGS